MFSFNKLQGVLFSTAFKLILIVLPAFTRLLQNCIYFIFPYRSFKKFWLYQNG